jgi:NADH:ubiquinone reductase (H+-translocating)
MAETSADASEQRKWLTFALVGAGPTGVELAGQIRELATKTLRAEYRKIEPEDARVLLLDGGDVPLASFGRRLSGKAADALRGLGVELHMNSLVTNVDLDGITVRATDGSETRHEVGTVLWTAGVEAPPIATALARATGAQQDHCDRIMVQDDLTIPGHPEISVIGDMMSLGKLPGVAEVAMQAGFYTGRRLRRQLNGQVATRSFRYHDLGSAAYIARGNAVVSAGPVRLSGLAGWAAWLFIHIGFLTGYRNRIGAILTWWLAFTRDIRRERAYTTRTVGIVRDLYQPTDADDGTTPGGASQPGVPRPPAQRTAPRRPAGRRPGR